MKNSPKHVTQVKNNNLLNILEYIHRNKTASKAEITKVLKLSAPTVSRNVNPLIGTLLKTSGKQKSELGRWPTLLEFNYGYANIMGIQIDQNFIRYGISDLSGSIKHFWVREISTVNFENLKAHLTEEINSITEDIAVVVFAISGYILKSGNIFASISDWYGIHVSKMVEIVRNKFPGAIVAFENDANLLAVRERFYTDNVKNIICIYWGRGIGAGFIFDGNLFVGEGMAGELGQLLNIEEVSIEDRFNAANQEYLVNEWIRLLINMSFLLNPEKFVLNGRFGITEEFILREWKKQKKTTASLTFSKGKERAIVEGALSSGVDMYLKTKTTGLKKSIKIWR
ncbi:MAG: hypothetical protein PWQ77_1798 [Kosmotogales bacterium]|nr:hypothetical protein [Kosmotogales bacterium]